MHRYEEQVHKKNYFKPELKLDKLRNDNFDQWDVLKDQIKSDDLIQSRINENRW